MKNYSIDDAVMKVKENIGLIEGDVVLLINKFGDIVYIDEASRGSKTFCSNSVGDIKIPLDRLYWKIDEEEDEEEFEYRIYEEIEGRVREKVKELKLEFEEIEELEYIIKNLKGLDEAIDTYVDSPRLAARIYYDKENQKVWTNTYPDLNSWDVYNNENIIELCKREAYPLDLSYIDEDAIALSIINATY